jgi:capsular polysaccharide biosynthesis protein
MPLGGKSYTEQVMLFYNQDIVIGPHGSAMANVFFMRPRSALIECNPPYFYEMCFANIAFISRVHYISVTNYNSSKIDKSLRNADQLYSKGKFFAYRRKYAKFSIYPNVVSVLDAVDNAIEFVYRNRFIYSRNDIWSRVFP